MPAHTDINPGGGHMRALFRAVITHRASPDSHLLVCSTSRPNVTPACGDSAAEGYGESGHGDSSKTDTVTSESTGFTPTTPVDHGEKDFAGNGVERITTDPGMYVDIHLDTVTMVLGRTPEGRTDMGSSDF